jgi:hypothetical protein
MQAAPVTPTLAPARPWRLALAGLALVVVALAALVGVMALRMAQPAPADLDYATTRLSDAGLYRVTYIANTGVVPINQLHTWTVHVETPNGHPIDGALITVDGDMPQHGHGLPTRPAVTESLGNGDYLVEGMKFQMGGWWVMEFDITAAGQADHVSFNLQLK